MKNVLNHKITKLISLVLCAILPCALFVSVFFSDFYNTMVCFLEKNLYNLLWCGWYGCVLVCLTFKNKWIKVVVIVLNLLPFGFGFSHGQCIRSVCFTGKSNYSFLPL